MQPRRVGISRRSYSRASTSLKAAAVERHQREKANVEIVEATHVDCNRLCALRCPPARERADAALRAELMVYALLSELIVPQILQARTQRKLVCRNEHPQRAPLLADRAVAGDHAADVGCDLETDFTAVTAAGVIPALPHRDLQTRNQRRMGQPAVYNVSARVSASLAAAWSHSFRQAWCVSGNGD